MNCPTCNDDKVVETKPAGAGHADDLAEYEHCPDCVNTRFPEGSEL